MTEKNGNALDARCRAMVLATEWSVNLGDSKGDRCPACGGTRPTLGTGHRPECPLGALCDDLRLVARAAKLVAGER